MATFTYTPSTPTNSLRLRLFFDIDAVEYKSYTITISATDVEGSAIEPTSPKWGYSSGLKAFFQYNPATRTGEVVLPDWTSDVYPAQFSITVAPWAGLTEAPDAQVVAVAAALETDEQPIKMWTTLQPAVDHQEGAS